MIDFSPELFGYISGLLVRSPRLNPSFLALVQVNTGIFTVSIALLTVLPSLIEVARQGATNFVDEELSLSQLDRSLYFLRISTAIIGSNAVFTAAMLIYPTYLGIFLSFVLTIVGVGALATGGYKITNLTKNAL